jgi:DNA-binding response OmpR family regulator
MTQPTPRRILIVEDDEDMRQMYSLLFSGRSYEVALCKSGQEALSSYRKNPFDLVIVELLLSGHDGFETLLNLQRLATPPKIIVTAKSSWTAAEIFFKMAKQLGADANLAKPFSSEQLLVVVQSLARMEK